MADHRITGLAPGLLLAALTLSGCPGSPSHMSTLPSEAPPPPQSGTLTAQVPEGSGLIIEAGSIYDLTRELDLIREDRELADMNRQVGPMMAFLGSHDDRYISSQVSDIHRFILPRLTRKIEQSPLRSEPWNGDFRLSFNVWSLHCMFENQNRVVWPHPICSTEIGVSLYETAGDSLLFGPGPMQTVSVKKETLEGGSTLEPLYEEAAQKIFDAFDGYWSSRPR